MNKTDNVLLSKQHEYTSELERLEKNSSFVESSKTCHHLTEITHKLLEILVGLNILSEVTKNKV